MLCENCKKNVATTYLKQTINGKTNEVFLCSECANKFGLGDNHQSMMSAFGFDSILPKYFSRSKDLQELRCPTCGIPFSEISRNGKVGCADCYTTFSDRLMPALNRMHGNKKHAGKIPSSFDGKPKTELEKLKKSLEKAIKDENFEEAAKLRDKIKELEKKNDEKK